MFWFTQGLCVLPVFLVIWSSSTFIISYVIAVLKHDVDAVFPYISDTGAKPPESCIFGLMTFVSACAGIATIYARYKFVEKLNDETTVVNPCLNKTALVFGMVTCLGMCIVATFQETLVPAVHDVGALLFFIFGIMYVIFQSVMSCQAHPCGSSASVCRARVAIAIIAAVAFFPTVVCAFFVKRPRQLIDTDDQDYPFRVASAVCEWLVAFSFVCFFLTYINDFKLFTLRVETAFEG